MVSSGRRNWTGLRGIHLTLILPRLKYNLSSRGPDLQIYLKSLTYAVSKRLFEGLKAYNHAENRDGRRVYAM
jgi:hypothetical protein